MYLGQNSQLGCTCPNLKCYPESCDHVYLFDNDYENAEDIHGKSMHGRFAYDERGRIVLEVMLRVNCLSLYFWDLRCCNTWVLLLPLETTEQEIRLHGFMTACCRGFITYSYVACNYLVQLN